MTLIWNDNLNTGIALIDEQHQLLFKTINRLGELNKPGTTKESLYEVLIELRTYVSLHFKTEEDYMRNTRYADYAHHKACHDQFAADYRNIFKSQMPTRGIMDLRVELVGFVEDWLKNHYTNEDVKMASFVRGCHLGNQ